MPLMNKTVNLTHRPSGLNFFLRLGTTDWYVANELFEEYEYATVKTWNPEDFRNIIDLGANIGLSIILWGRLSPKAHIKAVEPDPLNISMLRRNLNSPELIARCSIIAAFAGSKSGSATLDRSAGEWGVRMGNEDNNERVNVHSMDEIFKRTPISKSIDLLKCDIEGAEAQIFRECSAWINLIRNLIVEVHPPYSVKALMSDLRINDGNLCIVNRVVHGENEVIFLRQQANQ